MKLSSTRPIFLNSSNHRFSRILMPSSIELSDPLPFLDKALVYVSSVFIFSSVFWVPAVSYRAYRNWKNIDTQTEEGRRKKKRVGWILLITAFVVISGPHRHPKFGEFLGIRKWRLWKSWLKYVAFEVVLDENFNRENTPKFDLKNDQAIFAVVPHGLFPFPLALCALPELANRVFGTFRPVVATATLLFPWVRTLLGHLSAVDASKIEVDRALSLGSRIGVSPGGIAEMFVPLNHPNDEYALLSNRKGIIRMSIKHGVPIVPIFVFGGSKTFHRLGLPSFFEYLSNMLRISLCFFYGKWGLPIPFRTKLLYVIGAPLFPATSLTEDGQDTTKRIASTNQVDALHRMFCDRILDLFDRHKFAYGWENKHLNII